MSKIRSTKRIDSVAEYMAEVLDIRRDWKKKSDWKFDWQPWFRGEPDAQSTTALQPKLYRPERKTNIDKLLYDEQEMRLEFRRCGLQLITELPLENPWEWYFVMQHYGVPTRLLDWSDGALVALYFAVRDCARQRKDAAVYMLDPWWLNERVFKTTTAKKKDLSEGVALPDWAIDPSHVSRRVAAQRSRFTIFGRKTDGLKELGADQGARIVRIPIKAKSFHDIQRDLKIGGISESTIFPDLGFGRELGRAWEWRRSPKRKK